MSTTTKRITPADVATLRLCLKVSDMFNATVVNGAGEEVLTYSDYVPDFMPGEHYGDYVELEIEVATGRIVNWHVPTKREMEVFLAGCRLVD